jgi:hypothetical protein
MRRPHAEAHRFRLEPRGNEPTKWKLTRLFGALHEIDENDPGSAVLIGNAAELRHHSAFGGDFPERDRVAIIREEFGRSFFGVDIEPMPDVGFRSDVTIRPLAGASLSLNEGGGMHARRTRELLADGRDDFVMMMNLQGRSLVGQRDQEFVLDERAATIVTLGEIGGITRPALDHRVLRGMRSRSPKAAASLRRA